MPRQVMTTQHTIKANDLLRQHLKKVPDGDFWDYEEGWSDGHVAKTIGGEVNNTHIATLRLKLYGKLRPAPTVASHNKLSIIEGQVVALSTEVDNATKYLQAQITDLQRTLRNLTGEVETHIRRGHHTRA